MKKSKKLKILRRSCGTYDYCEFDFAYCANARYNYVLDFNERLCLCACEDDFILDGFEICRVKDIERVSLLDNATVAINRRGGLLDELEAPAVDITSWRTAFEALAKEDFFVIVQNEYRGFFRIGKIKRVKKNSVIFKSFDGAGVWQPKIKIPFSDITTVQFGNRYAVYWKKYLDKITS
ncbi:MAG: hypothetical protein K2J77_10980 [Oscillospiraceae bacterium]|nr:hypothetical protein [Oscillospiraceae bacterium]